MRHRICKCHTKCTKQLISLLSLLPWTITLGFFDMKHTPRAAGASRFLLLGLGVIIALLGVALAVGGAKLLSLGGSGYFLIGGVAMAISGLLIAKRKRAGAWLFAAFLLGTAVWAVVDVGLVF